MHEDSVCKHFGLGCPHETCIGTRKKKMPWNKVHCWQWTSQELSYWHKKLTTEPSLSVRLIPY